MAIAVNNSIWTPERLRARRDAMVCVGQAAVLLVTLIVYVGSPHLYPDSIALWTKIGFLALLMVAFVLNCVLGVKHAIDAVSS